MSIIYGTCGHRVEWNTPTVAIGSHEIDYVQERMVPCISYVVYCPNCMERVREGGIVLETKEAEQAWLNGS